MTPDRSLAADRFADRPSPGHSPQAGPARPLRPESRELFRHVSAERSSSYRSILDVFALAKRQYRLQLRPDEVLAEATWPGPAPRIEEVNLLLTQLAEWGNLESQADTSRVSSLSDFYRARFLYRLSHGGEAVEAGLSVFVQTLERRAELQSIALEDISGRLRELLALSGAPELDVSKIHESLRDLVRVFEGLAENAQAFMAGVARSIELQAAEVTAVVTYKRRLIDYLERFMGDLVRRSDTIARQIVELSPRSRLPARSVCTEGMPATAQRLLLAQLATAGARLRYHGDFDWAGVRIANYLMRELDVAPWRFGAADYLDAIETAAGRRYSLNGTEVAAAWDEQLTPAMRKHGIAIAEGAVVGVLVSDLDASWDFPPREPVPSSA